MRALQTALKISVWMVGRTHLSVASARIWWIAKMGRRVVVVIKFVHSWAGIVSASCKLSRWNLHSSDHSLGCSQHRWARSQRQWRAYPRCQLPAMHHTLGIIGFGGWSGGKVMGPSGRVASLGAWSQRPPGPNAAPPATGDPGMVVAAIFLYDQVAGTGSAASLGVLQATFHAHLATIFRRFRPVPGPFFFPMLPGHWTAGRGRIVPATAVRPFPGVWRLAGVGVWPVEQ